MNDELRSEVVHRWHGGQSRRGIARDLGISRRRVTKVIAEHRQTKRRPIDLHVEQLSHLIPLPERPYEVAEVVYRTVDEEGMASYAQNRYSAPWQYIGQVLARHLRFPPTERRQQRRQAEHLPPRDLVRRREVPLA